MPHFQEFTVIVIIFVLIFLSIVKIDQHKEDKEKSRLGIYSVVLVVSVALLVYVGYTTISNQMFIKRLIEDVTEKILPVNKPEIGEIAPLLPSNK